MPKHFTEAELLETYYMQPGASMPIMMHLADCGECAARYERLERKLRSIASCHREEKDETFWTRQRHAIVRRVAHQRRVPARTVRLARVAAAMTLVAMLGGYATWSDKTRKVETAAMQVAAVSTLEHDPWQAEELDEYQPLVDWESWGEP